MDRGAWWAIVHRVVKESDTTEVTQHACTHCSLQGLYFQSPHLITSQETATLSKLIFPFARILPAFSFSRITFLNFDCNGLDHMISLPH